MNRSNWLFSRPTPSRRFPRWSVCIAMISVGLAVCACNHNAADSRENGSARAVSSHDGRFNRLKPDEVEITQTLGLSHDVAWYVSTNVLAMQPRWDGLSAKAPLTIDRACELAFVPVRNYFPYITNWVVDNMFLFNLSDTSFEGFSERPNWSSNVWYYSITFKPTALIDREKVKASGFKCVLTQVVLPDGSVVPQTAITSDGN